MTESRRAKRSRIFCGASVCKKFQDGNFLLSAFHDGKPPCEAEPHFLRRERMQKIPGRKFFAVDQGTISTS
jgi:hypothetical protein